MSAIWTKICGITRAEDAETVARLGADAVGLVLYSASPRAVAVDQCKSLFGNLPAEVRRVALFVDPAEALVRQAVDSQCIDLLQFHGSETEDFCLQFDLPYMKAVRVRDLEQAQAEIENYPAAEKILLDKYQENVPGGTGKQFDWSIATKLVLANQQAIVLAGGLSPDNVQAAIRQVGPFGVDISSGVESAPGVKDPELIKKFIELSKSV